MTYRVVVEEQAKFEWQTAVDWLENRQPGLGLRLNTTIFSTLQSLSTNPERHLSVSKLARRIKIRDWPYSVYFVVNDAKAQISVIAIWHGARNPETLRQRLK